MADPQEKHYLLVISVLTSFSSTLMLSAVNIALPTIGNELSMNAVQLGWVAQSFTLAAAIFVLPFGRLADIWGRKKIFSIGLVIAIVSTLLSALSDSFPMFISLRVVQGIGMSMLWSTSLALLSSAYPPAERGKVFGINVSAVYLGMSLGPTIGGIMTQNIGWRSVFFLSVALQLPAMALLFARIRREWAEAKGEKFDIIGALLFAIMLFSLMYGFSLLPATLGIWIIVIGILGLVAFIMWELKVASPIFNIHLLTRNRLFAFSNLTQLMFYGALFSVSFILSLFLQYVKGLSPQDAGFVLLSSPAIQAIFSPIAGRISDKIQPRIVVSAAAIIALVGLLLLLDLTQNTPLLIIIIPLILHGFSFAFFSSPNTNAIMSSVEKKDFGVSSAIEAVTRSVGMTFNMGILMLLFSLYMGTAQITPEYHAAFVDSIRMAFIIFSVICLCCIVVSSARGKVVFKL